MSDVLTEIDAVAASATTELAGAAGPEQLEQWRIKYLSAKGQVKLLTQFIGKAPPDQKRVVGQRVNEVKDRVTAAFEARKASLAAAPAGPLVDVTEPGRRPQIGNRHLVMKVVDELTELFGRMGFAVAGGPEVEDEFHNFVALNIPRHHPARDPRDNFYLVPPDGEAAGRDDASLKLLRTQTSTVQIRVMETTPPPIRVVVPGRVYRPDTVDETHLPMFHQLEALVVDEGVTMIDLKSTIMQFVHAYFGDEARARFRPSFFPFTEPSAEVDVWFEDKQRWIELGGCGMVHPNVLAACNIDAERYTGWAFGFGIERIAMRKYAVGDIRHFVRNDVRFLSQF